MRLLIVTAAIAALAFPAFAQQGRPQQQQQQQRPPAQQAQPQAQPDAAAPGMFACRTENEICYIAIVVGGSQVSVLYSNDPKAEGIEGKPVSVQGQGGAPLSLAQHSGRVVMLTGQYGRDSLTNAAVVDVASPLLSFAIKSMLAGGEGEEEEEPEPQQQPPQRQPQQRR